MRSYGAALSVIAVCLLAVTPAQAQERDYTQDMVCDITYPKTGKTSYYAFNENQVDTSNGGYNGTLVETGYQIKGEANIARPVGQRPIWFVNSHNDGGVWSMTLRSQDAPQYSLFVSKGVTQKNNVLIMPAALWNKNTVVGNGSCAIILGPAKVQDAGNQPQAPASPPVPAPAPYTPPPALPPKQVPGSCGESATTEIYVECMTKKHASTSTYAALSPTPAPYVPPPPPTPTPQPVVDSVPLLRKQHLWHVMVSLGSTTKEMALDTGANVVKIDTATGNELIGKGQAHYLHSSTIITADGVSHDVNDIVIHDVQIGNRHLKDVVASMYDGGDMLLGTSALDQLGKYTIDSDNQRLIF